MDTDGNDFGLLALHPGCDPIDVDIVAIHGLDGHRQKSWTKGNVNWLRDFLPHDIPHARILTYGYDAFTRGLGKLACLSLYRLGQNLAADLAGERARSNIPKERPIIFVAHSLGGLVLKEALVDTFLKPDGDNIRGIELATSGIVFLGTPHRGSPYAALHKHITDVLSMIIKTNTAALKDLEPNTPPAMKALEQYDSIWRKGEYDQVCFYETLKTSMGGVRRLLLVPDTSATITGVVQRAMYRDHIGLVKFDTATDNAYIALRDDITRMARDAPPKIHKRLAYHNATQMGRAPTSFDIPPFQVPNFVDRPNLMERIESAFKRVAPVSSKTMTATLIGMGGQGKTQLAIEYCQKLQKEGSVKAIFWIDATTRVSVARGMESIAKRLFPGRRFDNEHDAEIAVREALRDWIDPWLMVFDGYDDVQGFSDIHTAFPQCRSGSILLTSRHRSASMLGTTIEVDRMETEEGLRLLLGSKLSAFADEERLTAHQILALLGYLPLAIDHARAYILSRNLPLTRFLSEYSARKADILRETPHLSLYRRKLSYADKEMVLSVVTTWELSLSQLRSSSPTSSILENLLSLLAFFHPNNIPEEIFSCKIDAENPMELFYINRRWDHLKFESLLAEMQTLSLLHFSNRESGYLLISLHPLVSEWLRLRLSVAAHARCLHLAQSHFGAYMDANDAKLMTFMQKQDVLVHLDRLCSSESKELGEGYNSSFYHSAGVFYASCGKFGSAEEMYHCALAEYERTLDSDHISTLSTVNNLGVVYKELGRMEEAKEMYNRALAGMEKTLEPNHASTLHTINNLGNLYQICGRLEQAEEMYRRALAGFEGTLGPDDISTIETVSNLGRLYQDRRHWKEAEVMYHRALAGKTKALGLDHTSTLSTVNNLGTLYCDRGCFEEAKEMYMRALTGYERALGPDDTSTLNTLYNLGLLYKDHGRLEEAEEMYMRALAGKEMAFGLHHPSTLDTVNNLGNLYRKQGRANEAEEMYHRALAGYEKALGQDHASTFNRVNTLYNLGLLYQDAERLEESQEMYVRALARYEKMLGPDHTSTLRTVGSLHMLYNLYKKQGRLEEAEEMYRRALASQYKTSR